MPVKRIHWEQELWGYISQGDGVICPIYQRCSYRAQGFQCSCALYSHLGSTRSSIHSGNDSVCSGMCTPCLPASHKDDVPCRNSNITFMEGLRPGRISELIGKLAERWLHRGRIYKYPVPIDLVSIMGGDNRVEIRYLPMKAYSGAIWRVHDDWVIYLNSSDTPQQQRITLFHEAFHLLAHSNCNPVFKKMNDSRGSFNELLGDDFSLQILMPTNMVLKQWNKHHSKDILVTEFDVPPDAVEARLRALSLI